MKGGEGRGRGKEVGIGDIAIAAPWVGGSQRFIMPEDAGEEGEEKRGEENKEDIHCITIAVREEAGGKNREEGRRGKGGGRGKN